MDLSQLNPLNIVTFVMSATAMLLSTLALFPGLRSLMAIFRDAVLWVALFFVLGGGGFIGWNQLQQKQRPATTPVQTANHQPATPGFTFDPNGRQ